MTTIRKTISISKKDKVLQDFIKNVPSYEVSYVIRQLMYDGLKYRQLVENGVINDGLNTINYTPVEKKEPKSQPITPKIEENDEDIALNEVKLEKIDEDDEDLEDLLLKNG